MLLFAMTSTAQAEPMVPRPGYSVTEYPPPFVAVDGQELTGQVTAVRSAYHRFYGVGAGALWVDDHHRAIVAIEAAYRIDSDSNAPNILALYGLTAEKPRPA